MAWAGFRDEAQRLCFGLALWNGRDAILKERAFGLANPGQPRGRRKRMLFLS